MSLRCSFVGFSFMVFKFFTPQMNDIQGRESENILDCINLQKSLNVKNLLQIVK